MTMKGEQDNNPAVSVRDSCATAATTLTTTDLESNSDDAGNNDEGDTRTSPTLSPTQPGSGRCRLSRTCLFWNCLFPIVLVVALVWGLSIAFGDGDWLPFRSDAGDSVRFDGDPFSGLNTDETYSWMSNTTVEKTGLSLQILNALDDTYQDNFDLVFSDWDNGSPDALSLTSRTVRDFGKCTPVRGKVKVCNGNYGPNGRNGEAQLVISTRTGLILSAVALLNDYYLADASDDLRRYTLCHEIGHSFGLPHTDEDFSNDNLGNCMDYTHDPRTNLQPDLSNYLTLKTMYGEIVPPPSGS